MSKMSVDEIIDAIGNEKTFHAVSDDYSFIIKIESYVHFICGAVHDGHQFRKELWENCLLSEYERWYEEDPETLNMVRTHPITIAGLDSRFEYDLNRDPENAIYEDAWGKKMWKQPLSKEAKDFSLAKHTNFYKVVNALVSKIEQLFGRCIVYDMHSYNWRRWDRKVPTWNLGTSNIDNNRFGGMVEDWRASLSEMIFPNDIDTKAKVNDTFQGNGYFLKFITNNFSNTLVLATEISKVYCNELSGVIYLDIVSIVEEELKKRIPQHATIFIEKTKP
ncbi:N-formylglutamate amidohydrolase [Aegicerativicinus sediminis]|uniref:N-formylglutamate amidohydrolase n=1 Tax=Aegicerativicinus sediminis TaxID=2893202 RepID=UPI001E6552BD|nr:N-formylglutamate amidohydrolase [Aegicerativicinus sediminis]